jgi:hypothetical protein
VAVAPRAQTAVGFSVEEVLLTLRRGLRTRHDGAGVVHILEMNGDSYRFKQSKRRQRRM